MTTPPYYLCS